MKRTLILAAASLLAMTSWAGRFNLGMPNAVKDVGQKLDQKIQNAIISGTAASGRAMAGAQLTLWDCNGKTITATTGSDGSFSVPAIGLSYPIFLRATNWGSSYYAVAYKAGVNNIHTFSDLAVRMYYRSSRGLTQLDSAVASGPTSICSPPPPSALESLNQITANALSPVFARNGLNAATYDSLTTGFPANSTGFDAVLDQALVTPSLDYSAVTITDGGTGIVVSTLTPVFKDSGVPQSPGPLAWSNVTNSTITISWAASISTDVAGYGVYRNGQFVTAVATTTFTDTGLAAGTTYAYAVDGFNWIGARSGQTASLAVATLATLSVVVAGNGTSGGTVTSNPAGITCGSICSASYNLNQQVTLTEAPDTNAIFTGWGGACSGTNSTCVLSMSQAQNVTARFDLPNTLTVSKIYIGAANGSVASVPAGINCGNSCVAPFAPNQSVTLIAIPGPGFLFAGWGGAGSGTGTLVLTMDASKTVTAEFTPQPPTFVPACANPCHATAGQSTSVPMVVANSAAGGSSPFTYTLDSGVSAPPGMTINPLSGALSGTPSTPGTYPFRVCITDANSLVSSPCPSETVIIDSPGSGVSVFDGTYSGTVTGIDTTPRQQSSFSNPVNFILANGVVTPMDSGSSGSGTVSISGAGSFTETSAQANGTFTAFFVVQTGGGVTASGTFSSTFAGGTGSGTWQATRTGAAPAPLSFTPACITTAPCTFNLFRNSPVSIGSTTGGLSPYSFAVAPGSSLPLGTNLSSAGVFGSLGTAPITPGLYSFGVCVTDGMGDKSCNQNIAINIITGTLTGQ